jgi:ABC-2 type transport system permease protein
VRPSVFTKTLRDVRRAFAWWSIGLVAMVAMMVSVWPSVRDNASLNKLVQDYPEALKGFLGFGGDLDYSSAAGYLGIELFSFVVPLLLLIAAINAGSNAVAGEEERGTLDLLLSLPVSRRRVVAEKLAALVAEVTGLALVLWLSLWIGARAVGMGIGVDRLAAATGSAALLAFAFGTIALAAGIAIGRRGGAVAAAAAAAVAAYLVNSLVPIVSSLASLQKASPFYYYASGDQLRNGFDFGHGAVLTLLWVAAGIVCLVLVDRRDLAA